MERLRKAEKASFKIGNVLTNVHTNTWIQAITTLFSVLSAVRWFFLGAFAKL
jgi:hypothetical protein